LGWPAQQLCCSFATDHPHILKMIVLI
jgi:hypothetical protein